MIVTSPRPNQRIVDFTDEEASLIAFALGILSPPGVDEGGNPLPRRDPIEIALNDWLSNWTTRRDRTDGGQLHMAFRRAPQQTQVTIRQLLGIT